MVTFCAVVLIIFSSNLAPSNILARSARGAGEVDMTQPNDFAAFLARMAKLDYNDIVVQADAECVRAEGAPFGKGGPHRRELGSVAYARQIREFLFFLHTGTRPASATERDFASLASHRTDGG
jgi:hypothetical protein